MITEKKIVTAFGDPVTNGSQYIPARPKKASGLKDKENWGSFTPKRSKLTSFSWFRSGTSETSKTRSKQSAWFSSIHAWQVGSRRTSASFPATTDSEFNHASRITLATLSTPRTSPV